MVKMPRQANSIEGQYAASSHFRYTETLFRHSHMHFFCTIHKTMISFGCILIIINSTFGCSPVLYKVVCLCTADVGAGLFLSHALYRKRRFLSDALSHRK